MFELSVACKYLLPRRRQLSVSIISLISIFVIALVVWLIVVFFSVTDGLEKSWVNKLTALTAPVRITPTDAYYRSYYYQVDRISEASDYSAKTIAEKAVALQTDPYNADIDEEIPAMWATPDRNADGQLKDPVKLAYAAIDELQGVSGLKASDFELTATNIRLRLARDNTGLSSYSFLTYPAFLGNFSGGNASLNRTLLPVTTADIDNLLRLLGALEKEGEDDIAWMSPELLRERLQAFLQQVDIRSLKVPAAGWTIPRVVLPAQADWTGVIVWKGERPLYAVIPSQKTHLGRLKAALAADGHAVSTEALTIRDGVISWEGHQQDPRFTSLPIRLEGGTTFAAPVVEASIAEAKSVQDLRFAVAIPVQEAIIQGTVPFRHLEIGDAKISSKEVPDVNPYWVHRHAEAFQLPHNAEGGDGILLPKSFKEAGVLVGDRGQLSYYAATASTLQEQALPVYVAGFYDPGIIPIGGKFVLANREVTSLIRASHDSDSSQDGAAVTNGINVHFDDIAQAEQVKEALQLALQKKGIARYWNVETYRNYEFTKDIMQELQSQKTIFTLIAFVIIIVACSNIISMLIILVNDKKGEIGILRSMGASSKSIALIFGLAGAFIGIMGSLAGITIALMTLSHLDVLIGWISHFHGHDLFNTAFYGEALPSEISYDALSFVTIATVLVSLLAGIVPAIKACLVKPSAILRAAGG